MGTVGCEGRVIVLLPGTWEHEEVVPVVMGTAPLRTISLPYWTNTEGKVLNFC